MKILMLIPQLSIGGAERSFSNLARLLGEDHEVLCVVFNKDHLCAYETGSDIKSLGVKGGGNKLNKVYSFYRRYKALKTLASQFDAESVISFLDGANFLNTLLPGRFRRIISQRGSVFQDITIPDNIDGLRIRAMRKLYRRADDIVVVSNYLKEEFHQILPENSPIHVVPNFIDADKINTLASSSDVNWDPNRFRIVLVGRLGPEKGIIHMLRVIKLLKDREVGSFSLVIIGDGQDRSGLEKSAATLGLTIGEESSDVYFMGRKENPYPYIKAADCLALASSAEGDPNVLLEAMACDTLILSVNCPGSPRERLAPGQTIPLDHTRPVWGDNGMLMPNFQLADYQGTLQSWADTIQHISESPEDYRAQVDNGRKYIGDFSPGHIKKLWLQIIDQ